MVLVRLAMKEALRDWWRSKRRSGRKGRHVGQARGRSIQRLVAYAKLMRKEAALNSTTRELQGYCDSNHSAKCGGGDVPGGAWLFGLKMRAIADCSILRMPKPNLRRLMDRWPAMLRSGAPLSFSAADPALKKEDTGRVSCLLPLSADIPFEEFSSVCAATIAKETDNPVLCVKLRASTPRTDSTPFAFSDLTNVFIQRVYASGEEGALAALCSVLDRARAQFAHVIVEAPQEVTAEALLEIIGRSCSVYPILRQDGKSLFALNLLCREARARGYAGIAIKPIVYLDRLENAHGLSCCIEETAGWPVHSYFRGAGDEERFAANLRRLGRDMCGCQVGLVLSSGGARGLAHVGVLQVLEENGIEVDIVAGSSMGAYIGAVWGAGYSGEQMEEFARAIEGYRGLWRLMDPAIFPRRGFLLTGRVRKRLEETIGALHFSDMARPIRIVATRLDTLERVVLSSGSVVDAVLASLAVPGICVPVMLDGVPYVDGGICDPLPVDALRDIGVRRIIAVNTIATPQTIKACSIENAVSEASGTRLLRTLNTWFNPFAHGNSFDTLMRSMHAAQTRLAEASCRQANVVLRPYSCEGRWHDFSMPSRYIALGRQEAKAQLSNIRKLISSSLHERETTQELLAQVA
jgi:NTE family protein